MVIGQQPLVSVLMTAWNREKYIGQAIESVLASTCRDFELIIVDDCSTDKTLAIAQSYAKKDHRIQVHSNGKNLGDYPNRNRAATLATGKYLKYVDADDTIYPWGLQLMTEMMEKNTEAGWGLCSLIQIVERPYPFVLSPKQAYEHHYFGPGLFHKAPLSAIIKRDVFVQSGGFSPLRMTSDFEMWHRLALAFPVLLMPDGMVWYREHSEQEVKSKKLFSLQYESIMLQYLQDSRCPLSREQIIRIKRGRKNELLKFMMYDLLKFRFTEFSHNLKTWFFKPDGKLQSNSA
ncbi:MAG TPA: glycosyltransferase family A protein [Flavitalea sp.]|nr:glycosyltransferase family A protein [Flavitalea sp.]